ncbi:hypothetical protein BDR26DRAFT_918233 [Obelidium mucronatum]|nr:hypothetical protein BDR26DRAFT_918233 [Obelidium mucronatum]
MTPQLCIQSCAGSSIAALIAPNSHNQFQFQCACTSEQSFLIASFPCQLKCPGAALPSEASICGGFSTNGQIAWSVYLTGVPLLQQQQPTPTPQTTSSLLERTTTLGSVQAVATSRTVIITTAVADSNTAAAAAAGLFIPSAISGKILPVFISSPTPASTNSTDPVGNHNNNPATLSVAMIAGISIGSLLGLAFVVVFVVCIYRRRRGWIGRQGPRGDDRDNLFHTISKI